MGWCKDLSNLEGIWIYHPDSGSQSVASPCQQELDRMQILNPCSRPFCLRLWGWHQPSECYLRIIATNNSVLWKSKLRAERANALCGWWGFESPFSLAYTTSTTQESCSIDATVIVRLGPWCSATRCRPMCYFCTDFATCHGLGYLGHKPLSCWVRREGKGV